MHFSVSISIVSPPPYRHVSPSHPPVSSPLDHRNISIFPCLFFPIFSRRHLLRWEDCVCPLFQWPYDFLFNGRHGPRQAGGPPRQATYNADGQLVSNSGPQRPTVGGHGDLPATHRRQRLL